jgi:hypothetical protein
MRTSELAGVVLVAVELDAIPARDMRVVDGRQTDPDAG